MSFFINKEEAKNIEPGEMLASMEISYSLFS